MMTAMLLIILILVLQFNSISKPVIILIEILFLFLKPACSLAFEASKNGLARIRVGVLALISTALGAERVRPVQIIKLAATLKAGVAISEFAFIEHTFLFRPKRF